ncbi:MAG: AbiV family abortive infection protein [Chitinophagaceae bacterium]|nr:AbiV family abortive infection protein [Chitinophagaceae bacterium]
MNTAKTFSNLTPKECLKVYPEVKKNADELYNAAKILANQGLYGKAISLLILGAEEYIKCFLLLLDGHRFNLRNVKKVNTIFKNHINRHSILRDTYSVWIAVKHLFSLPGKSTSKDMLGAFLNTGLGIFSAMSNYDWWKQAGIGLSRLDSMLIIMTGCFFQQRLQKKIMKRLFEEQN